MGQKINKETPTQLDAAKIESLAKRTRFSPEEIESQYQKFMSNSPSGTMNKKEFVDLLSRLRPDKDVELFGSQLFNGFDTDHSGIINFEEYLIGVGLTSNSSSTEEKLKFALRMYDVDGDKELSMGEVEKMVRGLNQFSGNNKLNQTDQPKEVVTRIFNKYDKDANGILSQQEFMEELLTFPIFHAFKHFSVLRND